MYRLWMLVRMFFIIGVVAGLLIGCAVMQEVQPMNSMQANVISSVNAKPIMSEVYGKIPVSSEVYQR